MAIRREATAQGPFKSKPAEELRKAVLRIEIQELLTHERKEAERQGRDLFESDLRHTPMANLRPYRMQDDVATEEIGMLMITNAENETTDTQKASAIVKSEEMEAFWEQAEEVMREFLEEDVLDEGE